MPKHCRSYHATSHLYNPSFKSASVLEVIVSLYKCISMVYRRRANTASARELIMDKNIKNSLRELASMKIKSNLMGLQNVFDQKAGQQS